MGILDAKPIESALPTLGRPMLSLDGNEDQIVGALRQRLTELEQCASQRAGLEDMLKDMRRKDNILPKLMWRPCSCKTCAVRVRSCWRKRKSNCSLSREDAQVRAQFGTKWMRSLSQFTKPLRDQANGFAANLKQVRACCVEFSFCG